MARKRKYIDRKLMKTLAMCQLTNEEMARCLRVSKDTIERRYAAAIKAWKGLGVSSVRRELYVTALSPADTPGKMTATIFFLKNYGGLADVTREEARIPDFGDLPNPIQQTRSGKVSKPN
jgi:hypothetical protein